MKRKHDKKSIVMSSERATINPRLPKHYDGYNVDALMEKWYQGKQLNPKEHEIFKSIIDAYYEPELQKDCSQGFIRLLKIHDKGIYPTDSAVDTPYWKSIVGKKKPNADDALTDDDLRKELEALEADVEEMSKRDPLLPRYYKGYDIDALLKKVNEDESISQEENIILCNAIDIYYKKEHRKRHIKCELNVRETNRKAKNPLERVVTMVNKTVLGPDIDFYVRDMDDI